MWYFWETLFCGQRMNFSSCRNRLSLRARGVFYLGAVLWPSALDRTAAWACREWLTPILLWLDLLEAKSFRSLLLIEAKFGLMVPAMPYVPPPLEAA